MCAGQDWCPIDWCPEKPIQLCHQKLLVGDGLSKQLAKFRLGCG